MSSALTLEQLVALGGSDGVNLSNPQKNNGTESNEYVSPFADKAIVPVEITEQVIKTTKNGYTQLELARSVIKDDGTTAKAGRIWITLPVFTEEVQTSVDSEKLAVIKNINGKALHNLLRATMPEQFTVFTSVDKTDKKNWKFIAPDGTPMTKEGKEERESILGAAVTGAARAIIEGSLSLVGKRLYMQEVPKKNKPEEHYLNCYAEMPTDNG